MAKIKKTGKYKRLISQDTDSKILVDSYNKTEGKEPCPSPSTIGIGTAFVGNPLLSAVGIGAACALPVSTFFMMRDEISDDKDNRQLDDKESLTDSSP